MTNKIYIRASMLPSWNDCPRRSAANQYKKLILASGYRLNSLFPSVGAAIGTSMHKGAENSLKTILEKGVQAKKSECVDIGIETLKTELKNGAVYDTTTPTPNTAEQQTIQMINAYCVQVTPKVKPGRIENQFESLFPGNIIFTGKSDVETIDNGIRDIKGGVKLKLFHGQLGGYSLLRKNDTRIKTESLIIDFVPRVSLKKTYPGVQQISYDVNFCEKFAWYTIQQIGESVKRFVKTKSSWSFPCNPMSMLCSEKYCPAFRTDFCEVKK